MAGRPDTDWVRRYWDRSAGADGRSLASFEKGFYGGAKWIGSRALRGVLDVGVESSRNLAEYSTDAWLTGTDLSREVNLRLGDA